MMARATRRILALRTAALLAAALLGLPSAANVARAAGPDELVPVSVSFSKLWDPRDYGRFGLRPRDVEKIRGKVAALAQATFVKVLAEGGYRVVERTDAGEMTLALELRDAVTGTLLAEARDRQRGIDRGRFTVANSVTNRAEAERVLRGWAMRLRDSLDAARQGR
jgi:hypothetical protein